MDANYEYRLKSLVLYSIGNILKRWCYPQTQMPRIGLICFGFLKEAEEVENIGGPCWIRTNGPLIKSQMLYQLS
jgi:hypothetical protein